MDLIKEFIRQYKKEYDFYDMAGRIVAKQLDESLQAAGIRAIVTSRAKDPRRLELKVAKRAKSNADHPGKRYQSLKDIYEDIVDLAGVRIALYFPGDIEKVDRLINDLFDLKCAPKIFPEPGNSTDSPNYKKRFSGYSATHYRIKIKESTQDEDDQRYCEATVEIQVASVLMHAWSEVEHDLVYKPLQGKLSDEEYAILDEINGMVLAGEIALERLQKAIEVRVRKEGAQFGNHYELASYLYEAIKSQVQDQAFEPILGDVELLYSLAKKLNIASSEGITPYISAVQQDGDRSITQQIIDQILEANPDRYTAYQEIRSEENLIRNRSSENINSVGQFLTQWIRFEIFLREIIKIRKTKVSKSDYLSSATLHTLNIFDEDEISEIEQLRRTRTLLLHGVEFPSSAFIQSATDRISDILQTLADYPDSDVRQAAQTSLNTPF
jgi:ppGpp synthetase/RelA/SpoT-type nucleotidyltranferase